jgi:UDP-glucose 4-epimerase
MELSTLSLRYFNVYGNGQNPNGAYAAAVPRFIEAAARGDTVTIFGDGRQIRDFVFVDDIVAANMAGCVAEGVRVSGVSLNIGTGQPTSLNQLIDELSRLVGHRIAVRNDPARTGDIRRSVSKIDRAREILGYKPDTTLRLGLQRMLTHALK